MSEFWWGLLWVTLFIPLMFLWGFVLWDVFSRVDLKGWEKALWAIGIVFFPLVGMLVYFIARPKKADSLTGYAYGSSYAAPYAPYGPYGTAYPYRPEDQRASGPAPNASDVETLGRLHQSGTLSDEEYNQLTQRLSSQQRGAA